MKTALGFLLDLFFLVIFIALGWFVFSQLKDIVKEELIENKVPLQQQQQPKQHKQQPVKKNSSGKMITAPLGAANT